MKYNEIFEQFYQPENRTPEQKQEFWSHFPPMVERGWMVLNFFMGRKGFDSWWDGIDDEVRNEIFEELVGLLERMKH